MDMTYLKTEERRWLKYHLSLTDPDLDKVWEIMMAQFVQKVAKSKAVTYTARSPERREISRCGYPVDSSGDDEPIDMQELTAKCYTVVGSWEWQSGTRSPQIRERNIKDYETLRGTYKDECNCAPCNP